MSKLPLGARIYPAMWGFCPEKCQSLYELRLCLADESLYLEPMSWKIMLLPAALFLSACASSVDTGDGEKPERYSPAGALVRGELKPEEYFGAIKKANERDRQEEQFIMNREPTRAYNTKTGRIEYVPEGTTQRWNEQQQRWEFTPITD
jgi:hypothetical protein